MQAQDTRSSDRVAFPRDRDELIAYSLLKSARYPLFSRRRGNTLALPVIAEWLRYSDTEYIYLLGGDPITSVAG